jgi:two-component system, cell cycle response regulator DivK
MDRKVVLVVEDNQDELMIYTTLLSYKGYAILTAADYHTAVRIAREQKPDLAIIDVNLGDPTYDGTDLVRAIRGESTTTRIPIIAHTAYADVYAESLADAGCDRVIHKPTNPTVLIEAVEALIGPAASMETGGADSGTGDRESGAGTGRNEAAADGDDAGTAARTPEQT